MKNRLSSCVTSTGIYIPRKIKWKSPPVPKKEKKKCTKKRGKHLDSHPIYNFHFNNYIALGYVPSIDTDRRDSND